MNMDAVTQYLLSKPEAVEDYPFGKEAAVFKVRGKIFALCFHQLSAGQNDKERVNLKCDPAQAFILRDIFHAIIPGYHMNKKHWNTIILNQTIPRGEIERMIDHSYGLVVRGLTKKQRTALEIKYGPKVLYR
jgi:predicted DNA-binding protein (MmcQ/YjbR family)|tara:strand:- start:1630 stop:2025 length:396 start_codon:yes stop_codon:yes gene_type:complete